MRVSTLLAIAAVTLIVGFVPAPLPRRDRGSLNRDDLDAMQGSWKMTGYDSNGRSIGFNYKCRVKGNRWTFYSLDNGSENETATYVFNLEYGCSPRAFEWLQSDAPNAGGWVGSYELWQRKKLTLVFNSGTIRDNLSTRATDFSGATSYKITLDYLGR